MYEFLLQIFGHSFGNSANAGSQDKCIKLSGIFYVLKKQLFWVHGVEVFAGDT